MSEDKYKHADECKFLKNAVILYVMLNLGIFASWVVYLVLDLRSYISSNNFFSIFEYIVLLISLIYLLVLYVKFYRTTHPIFKKLIGSCLEIGLFCSAVLIVYSALKIGVASAMNYIAYYLDYFPNLKLKETKLIEMVLVYPGFVCLYITALLHMGIKALRLTGTTYNLLKAGESLDEAYQEELDAEDADDY